MPAAAVIPAPIVYIKVAAVKKLVVGLRRCFRGGFWVHASFGVLGSWFISFAIVSTRVNQDLLDLYWVVTSYFLLANGGFGSREFSHCLL